VSVSIPTSGIVVWRLWSAERQPRPLTHSFHPDERDCCLAPATFRGLQAQKVPSIPLPALFRAQNGPSQPHLTPISAPRQAPKGFQRATSSRFVLILSTLDPLGGLPTPTCGGWSGQYRDEVQTCPYPPPLSQWTVLRPRRTICHNGQLHLTSYFITTRHIEEDQR
jgi:hypothetical protein